jgi:hypothetical protein
MFVKKYKYWCDSQYITDTLNHYSIPFQLDIDNNGMCYIKIEHITPGNIHAIAAALLPPKHIDHYASDLYIKVSPLSKEIIQHLSPASLLSTFIDNIDHVLWYDLPFCYNPNIKKLED